MMLNRVIGAIAITLMASSALWAQDEGATLRLDRLEREMHAVQRKVFPNGQPVQPELTPSAAGPATEGSAASAPLTDLNQRLDLLEGQVKALTGQVEQYSSRLRVVEESQTGLDKRVKAIEVPQSAPLVRASDSQATAPSVRASSSARRHIAAPADDTARAGAPVRKDRKREALVAAVAVPDTGNAMEDSYSYAFRLFEAKLYPEAEAKLDEFVAAYPHTRKFSNAQNLLGRAYYEEGKYPNAAKAFVDNYTRMPKGERAAESLSWAGLALLKDGAPDKACRVYREFDDVYGQAATRDVAARVARGRAQAQCSKA